MILSTRFSLLGGQVIGLVYFSMDGSNASFRGSVYDQGKFED